jgi:hypothetical protein
MRHKRNMPPVTVEVQLENIVRVGGCNIKR